ncbi:MAG TPA: helix-hairpin-helix domain-containing protein [Gammaproteobacteria bacterium]|nr:helix-hairpin-helix domain-containing protein [Gammaproteobacteria bacterium]
MSRLIACLLGFTLYAVTAVALAAPVNVNQASARQIAAALQGIGTVKAKAIVAYRKEHGPFRSVDALSKVDGIGPQTLANIRKDVKLGNRQQ